MKFKNYLFCALAAVSIGSSMRVAAQSCLVSSLNISTGYLPLADSVDHAEGHRDPNWTVTQTLNTPTSPTPGAHAVINFPVTTISFPYQASSAWISFDSSTHTAYYASNASLKYLVTLTRSFRLCAADNIALNMTSVCRDNYIDSIFVDGVNIGWSDPTPGSTVANYTTFMPLPAIALGHLGAGTHTLSIRVANDPSTVYTQNYHGLNMNAYLVSPNTSLVKENSVCANYSCNLAVPATTAAETLLSQNAPNPFTTETIIRYQLPAIKESAVLVVTDLAGRVVLQQPIKQSGAGSITIYGNQLKSGIYFYTISADGVRLATRKMVLACN